MMWDREFIVKRVASGILLSALALLAVPSGAADLEAIKERGTLKVAVAVLSPFVSKDENGALIGHEIEATGALADALGVAVDYVEKPFCELAKAIVDDEADIIASGYSNIDRRRAMLAFTLPYHDTEYFLAMAKDVTKERRSLRALNDRAVSIGYQVGGVSGTVAKGEFPGADLKGYDSFAQIMDNLRAGEIDGAVLFGPYLKEAKKMKGRKLGVPHEFALTRTIEAFATQQGNDALIDAVNAWIIQQDLAGYWDALEDKWLSDADGTAVSPPPYACPSAATG
ncbi:MAG: ABC transporter substrate-binding protein [Pseudomonadota bacterium]